MSDTKNTKIKKEPSKKKCTFEISVKCQQNDTWQGSIHWAEKNEKQHFRSVLEMLKLMDEALTDGDDDAVSWEK